MTAVFQTTFPPSNLPIIDDKGAMSQQFMPFLRALFNRTGQGSGLQNQVNATVAGGQDLTADWNLIASGSGDCKLPSLVGGQMVMVQNSRGSTVIINPPNGATIDGAANYSLIDTKMQIFWFFSSTVIVSTQLG